VRFEFPFGSAHRLNQVAAAASIAVRAARRRVERYRCRQADPRLAALRAWRSPAPLRKPSASATIQIRSRRCGRAGVGSAEHSPSRIEPHLGQVSEYSAKPPSSEHWRVLHEREAGSYFTNDAGHFHPEAGSLAFDPGALAGCADVLAGKAARNDINTASPRSAVKSCNVRPNGEGGEKAVVLSLHKNGCGVGIKFNGADGSPPEELPPEYSATSAREKSQLIH
jgi:hypothetical protein